MVAATTKALTLGASLQVEPTLNVKQAVGNEEESVEFGQWPVVRIDNVSEALRQ